MVKNIVGAKQFNLFVTFFSVLPNRACASCPQVTCRSSINRAAVFSYTIRSDSTTVVYIFFVSEF